MFYEECGAFVQHERICVVVQLLSNDLKSSKLLRGKAQVQCFGDIASLKNRQELKYGQQSRTITTKQFVYVISVLHNLMHAR